MPTHAEVRARNLSLGKRCKGCGKMFYPVSGKAKRFKEKVFCSWDCRLKKYENPMGTWLKKYKASVTWKQPKHEVPNYKGFEIVTDCRSCVDLSRL